MASSSATCTDAAPGRLVAALASGLGVADPRPLLGGLLDLDVAHSGNALLPGGPPLELSFSEGRPGALRLEVEPYGPQISAAARLERATGEVRELARAAFGAAVARSFDRRVAAWKQTGGALAFGAFAGAVVDASGLVEVKLYRELAAGVPADAPGPPGARPHFVSLAAGPRGVAQRVYFVCEQGLRLLDLADAMQAKGLEHRLPALADTISDVTSGSLFLPPGSALVALRDTAQGAELKVELLGDALPPSGEDTLDGIRRALAERPASLRGFERFLDAVETARQAPAKVAALSVRCTAATSCTLNVYLRS